MKIKLTGNELSHFLFLKALPCRVRSTHLVILSKFKKNWMRNGWVIVDSNLEKNRKWKGNLQEMNNYISCFWSYYLIGYIYVDTCSIFQIDLLRNVWDMHKRIFFIFNFKTGNEDFRFMILNSLSYRIHLCRYLFKISDQSIEKWLRYILLT